MSIDKEGGELGGEAPLRFSSPGLEPRFREAGSSGRAGGGLGALGVRFRVGGLGLSRTFRSGEGVRFRMRGLSRASLWG